MKQGTNKTPNLHTCHHFNHPKSFRSKSVVVPMNHTKRAEEKMGTT